MCRADISDRLTLTIDEAGLADEAFFIDGIGVQCRVANPSVRPRGLHPQSDPGPTTTASL